MIGKDLEYAASLLRSGEILAVPTETVYGLAANALLAQSVIKIYEIKNRPRFNPLIVHTNTIERVANFTTDFPKQLQSLAEKFWPGPLTMLLPKSEIIPQLVTAGSEMVAVRIPNHPVITELLSMLPFPLCAPSANPSGYISPTSPLHVEKQLGEKIPYILDGGVCTVGIESTIIKLNDEGKVVILREGGITSEEIKTITGYAPIKFVKETSPEAPGMLKSHYAPAKQLLVGNITELLKKHDDKSLGIITFSQGIEHPAVKACIVLSSEANLYEAAKNLFAALHELDETDIDVILAEYFPDEGIGKAINDRLHRASVQK